MHPPFYMEHLYEELLQRLRNEYPISLMWSHFEDLESCFDRVQFTFEILKKYSSILPQLPSSVKSKSENISSEYRLSGNHFYQIENYEEAYKKYNYAILYAPMNSTELALAYEKRSEALFHLRKYKECLIDISRTLQFKCDHSKRSKLLKSRTACKKANFMNAKPDKLTSKSEDKCMFFESNIHQNHARSDLKISFSDNYGRYILATNAIPPGKVLAIEAPYISKLEENFYNLRCYYCCRINFSMIPCETCSFVMFCDEACRRQSWKQTHNFECSIMSFITHTGLTSAEKLSLSTVIQAKNNLELWYNMHTVVDNTRSEYKNKSKNFDMTNAQLCQFHCYSFIYNLHTNLNEINIYDQFKKYVTATLLLYFLKEYTLFFDGSSECEIDTLIEEKNIFFIGELLLYHIIISELNSFGIEYTIENNQQHIFKKFQYASGIYPFMSLFNHSCSPNAEWFNSGTSLVLMALRPIKRNQQIFISYGPYYATHGFKERQKILKNKYGFDCKCEACTDKWPLQAVLHKLFQKKHILKRFEKSILHEINEKIAKRDKEYIIKLLEEMYRHVEILEKCIPSCELVDYQTSIRRCWYLLSDSMFNSHQNIFLII